MCNKSRTCFLNFMQVFALLLLLSSTVYASSLSGWEDYFDNDFDAAEKVWKRALENDRPSPLSNFGLGILSESRGDLKGACERFSQGAWQLATEEDLPEHERLIPIEVYVHQMSMLSPLAFGSADLATRLEVIIGRPLLSNESSDMLRYYLFSLYRETGDVEKAEQVAADLHFLSDFHVIGPFDSPEKSGWNTVYPPEEGFRLDAECEGKRQKVRWKPLNVKPKWGFIDLWNQMSAETDATAYLTQFIDCSEDRRIRLCLGCSGAAKVWLNGRLLLGEEVYHPAWLDQRSAEATLKQGTNQILVKVCSDPSVGWGCILRMTDVNGATIALEPAQPPEEFLVAAQSVRSETGSMSGQTPLIPSKVHTDASPVEQALNRLTRGYLYRAWNFYKKGVSPDKDEVLKAVDLFPENPLVNKLLAVVEDDDNARIAATTRAAQADPRDVEAQFYLFHLLQQTQLYDGPMEAARKALARNPDYPPTLIAYGRELELRGGKVQALDLYARATQLAPAWMQPYSELGLAITTLLSEQLKEKYLKKGLERSQVSKELRRKLMEIRMNAGDALMVDALANEGLEQDPTDISIPLQVGTWHRNEGRTQEAEAWLEKARTICPENPDLNKELGFLRQRQGDMETALDCWNRSLRIRPNDSWLQEYITQHSETGEDYYANYRVDWRELPPPSEVPEYANVYHFVDQEVRKVYRDGTSRRTVQTVTQVINTAGIRQMSAKGIYYVPSREKVVIHTAKVVTPSGREILAKEPQDRPAMDAGSVGGGIYNDYNVIVIYFEGLEKGAVVELEYEVQEQQENLYSDYFGDIFYFGSYEPTALSQYVIEFPKERDLYHRFIDNDTGFAENLTVTEVDDSNIYQWSLRDLPGLRQEPMMPEYSEMVPYVKTSTFSTWDEMARWYWDLSKENIQPDSAVRAQVKQLEHADSGSVLQRVKSIYNYIANDVRYLGLEFGIHGYKPHRAAEVCRTQYGDCKDKAGLGVAMLEVAGIPAEMALLRTRNAGDIDYELPSLGLFNHAILHLDSPELETEWFDATAQYTAVGEIPVMDQGARALVVGEGGRWQFKEIPVSAASENGMLSVTGFTLSEDGSALGKTRTTYDGFYNPYIRQVFQNDAKNAQLLESEYGSIYPGTQVTTMDHSDFKALNANEWISFTSSLPNYARKQGQTLAFPASLFPEDMSSSYASLTSRKTDLVNLYIKQKKRIITVAIPDSCAVTQIPKPVDLQTEFGSYSRIWTEEGKTLKTEEVLSLRFTRITPERYPAFRDFCAAVDREQKKEVVLLANDGQ